MSEVVSNADLLAVAVEATRTAGKHALENSHRRSEAIMRAAHDVKLALDVECQQIATQVISAHFPAHNILGEEDSTGTLAPTLSERSGDRGVVPRHAGDGDGHTPSSKHHAPRYQWIIDPIDGTVNFSHGMRQWCCSIAVRNGDETVAGAVFAPALDELYTATIDGSALLNNAPLRVSDTGRLADAVVCTGMDKKATPELPPYSLFMTLAENTQKARIMGSAALDICHVARGEADAYFETGIFIWDVAAAGLIVRQAGGKAAILRHLPEQRLIYLASNGKLQQELIDLLKVV